MSWKKIQEVEYIVVHCAATPPEVEAGVNAIRTEHLRKGWFDVGYHFVVRRDGTIETGRPTDRPGAHARGFNHKSLGICLEGGVDGSNAPKSALKSLRKWLEWYTKNYSKAPAVDNFTDDQYDALAGLVTGLKVAHPDATVLGHRDLPNVNKGCPSFNAIDWWAKVEEKHDESSNTTSDDRGL